MSEKNIEITPICETCVWWADLEAFEPTNRGSVECTGQCRRYPPIPMIDGSNRFPITGSDCGCGEWMKRQPKEQGE